MRSIVDIESFWNLIESTRAIGGRDVSRQASLLLDALADGSIDSLLDYAKIMDDLMDRAYDAALWDAADIIGCGCSDDGFYEFRGWLIAQGKQVYEAALTDPESLVDLIGPEENAQDGSILYVVRPAYEKKTGHELSSGYRKERRPPALSGEHWPEEKRMQRFPKLAAKFGDCEQRWPMWLDDRE